MTSNKVYYILGQMVFAIANANGTLNEKERLVLQNLFVAEMGSDLLDLDLSEVISHILKKEKKNLETTYNWGFQLLNLQQNKLDDDTKSKFLHLIDLVITRFPSQALDVVEFTARLRIDLEKL